MKSESAKRTSIIIYVLRFQSKKSKAKERERRVRGEPSSLFQRRRVNMILDLMTRKFPPKLTPPAAAAGAPSAAGPAAPKEEPKEEKQEGNKEVKSEKAEANAAAPGSQQQQATAAAAGIKREAGQISRGPDPKKSKMS